jgi:hypothetical protein
MEKECNRCKELKLIKHFRICKNNSDGLDNLCKLCRREADRLTYSKHSYKYRKKIALKKKEARYRNHQFVLDYLLLHPCVDCGESDPIVLEFDHKHTKEYSVSNLIRDHSIEKIIKEIEKCEVRCANCHRRKTAKDFNYYKYSKVAEN